MAQSVNELNARDGNNIEPNQASLLLNFVPEKGHCTVRQGYSEFSEISVNSKALMSVGNSLIAIYDNKACEIVPGGNIELASGLNEEYWQSDTFNNYLFGVSGNDIPFKFDGTTWTDAGFTYSGLDVSTLINVEQVRNRIWFTEKGSADAYYGGVMAITGALGKFQCSQLVGSKQLLAIEQYSQDAGDGFDDYTCFIFDTGEILLYSGDVTTSLALVGKYQTSKPIGYNCTVKLGGEILIITELGIIPLSQAMTAIDIGAIPTFGRIAPLISEEAESGLFGWSGFVHGNFIYFKTPNKQIVLNTLSNAWTIFDYPMAAHTVFDEAVYFADNDFSICVIGGVNDKEQPITLRSEGAFINLNDRDNNFTHILPVLTAEGFVAGRIGVQTDYYKKPLSEPYRELISSLSSTAWGSAWGSAWSNRLRKPRDKWLSARGRGNTVSTVFEIDVVGQQVSWHETRLKFKRGSK